MKRPDPAEKIGRHRQIFPRCDRCGKVSFPTLEAARDNVAFSIGILRRAGLVARGETPAGITASRPYRCGDREDGPWHNTKKPLMPVLLPPDPSGVGSEPDLLKALAEAIRAQRDRRFPTRFEFAQHYGIGRHATDRLYLALRLAGLLIYDPGAEAFRSTMEPPDVSDEQLTEALAATRNPPDRLDRPPTMALPPCPPDADAVPEVLLNAVLRQQPGLRLPRLAVLAEHFAVGTTWMWKLRIALTELGWLRREGEFHVTARPDAPAQASGVGEVGGEPLDVDSP